MICTQCGERTAVVNLHQIANGEVVLLHLCEKCAAERGVENTASITKTPVGNFLASMSKGLDAAGSLTGAVDGVACPVCRATLDDFRETGRLGCAECYRTFEAPLRDLLRRLHGSSRHFGKRYSAEVVTGSNGPPNSRELREQLQLAVQAENFELAAELRDRLRLVEPGS